MRARIFVGLGLVLGGLLAGGLVGCGPRTVTLACVGDVMVGRGVARFCAVRGADYPFALVGPLLRRGDLTFGNLESPLTDLPTRFPRVNALHGSPEMAAALAWAGFRVMSVANNHAIDYGRPGLAQTREVLARAGIVPVGAGDTQAEAERGAVVTAAGVPVGFLAYSNFPYTNFVHDPDRESVLLLSEEALRRTIPPLARRCRVLVVSFHWGKEGERGVSPEQRRLAHLAVELGASLVVGSHPHVRSEIEPYRQGLIAYDLGNLVFDAQSYGGNEGWVLRCVYDSAGRLKCWDALPVEVADGQARISESAAARGQ